MEVCKARLGLARVSVVRGEGPAAGSPAIDDYIRSLEPISDYLTKWSGLVSCIAVAVIWSPACTSVRSGSESKTETLKHAFKRIPVNLCLVQTAFHMLWHYQEGHLHVALGVL